MLRDLLGGWIGLRARWRGYGLPFFAAPLLPAALFAGIAGDNRIVIGCVAGFGASLVALRLLQRGRDGDTRRAAWVVAAGTGLAAWLAAGLGLFAPAVAVGALFGTRLMYRALPEAPPTPGPAETLVAWQALVEARCASLARFAATLVDPRFASAVDAVRQLAQRVAVPAEPGAAARREVEALLLALEEIEAALRFRGTVSAEVPVTLDRIAAAARGIGQALDQGTTVAFEDKLRALRAGLDRRDPRVGERAPGGGA